MTIARTGGTIPAGRRLTDCISLGVLTVQLPRELVDQVLCETERVNAREREWPAHVTACYVLALYAEVSTQEVIRRVLEERGARRALEKRPAHDQYRRESARRAT